MDWLMAGTQAAQELCRLAEKYLASVVEYQGRLIIAETGHSTSARLRDLFKRFDKAWRVWAS